MQQRIGTGENLAVAITIADHARVIISDGVHFMQCEYHGT